MVENDSAVLLTFGVYLVTMLGIGVYAYRQTHDLSDYILGGRKLGRWVAALSAGASDMSGWLLLGLPGYAYAAGLEAGWIALGLLVGTWLNWRLVANRLRLYTQAAGDALTLPDFFERRFQDRSRLLRVTSAFFILMFFTFYTSSGLVAGGKLFSAAFGFPYHWALLAGAGAIILYTILGGFLAVSWTDVVQGLLMLFALVLVPTLVIQRLGGYEPTLHAMVEVNPYFLDPLVDTAGEALSAVAILSLLGWGLGYFGQPHILTRFMAIRRPEHIAGARIIGVSWSGAGMLGAVAVGVAGIGFLKPGLSGGETEKVFIHLVTAVFHPAIAGILLAAILAAIMSTADSQLLVASSALTEDFYKALWRENAKQRELVWVGRGAVMLIAAVAFMLALQPDAKVLDLVAYAWAGFGAAFGPTLLLSLFWRRMTASGALAGIIVGGVTVIVWKQLEGGLYDLYEIIPGFVLSTIAILVMSLVSPTPSDEITHLHDEVSRIE
jgi:sodium/proline symporter